MRRAVAGLVALLVLALAACSAETEPATEVSHDRAQLRGIVRWIAGDGPGQMWWEYRAVGAPRWLEQGPRTNVPLRSAAGSSPVDKALTGLAGSTTYEYRICGRHDLATLTVCYDADGSTSAGAWDRFTTDPHPTVTPAPAIAFNDSVGVATHPTYLDTVHAQESDIAQLIAGAGIRHVRNEMVMSDDAAWNRAVWTNMGAWPRAGIVSSWRVDRCAVAAHEGHTVRMYLAKIAEIDGDLSSAIEGTNEVNLFCREDWVSRERRHVASLYDEVRGNEDPVIRSLDVLGPSFSLDGEAEIGDISEWIDLGNTHPYSGCRSPTPEHVQQYGIDDYAPAGGSKPVVVTEVGFHTAVSTTEPTAQPPCDERTAGVYTLRTVLEHFKLGIARTHIYEAVDLWPDPRRIRSEWNFGILRNDLTPKPAYTYLANLLGTTRSPDGATLTPLKLSVERGPPDLRTLLLRQANGDYVLALWRHSSVWDREARQPIAVPPAEVTVGLPTATSVAAVQPHLDAEEIPVTLADGRATVHVAGDAILLVIR